MLNKKPCSMIYKPSSHFLIQMGWASGPIYKHLCIQWESRSVIIYTISPFWEIKQYLVRKQSVGATAVRVNMITHRELEQREYQT